MRGISWLAANQLAAQERLCTVEEISNGCKVWKNIRINCRTYTGALFYNYKQFFYVVLSGVADLTIRFLVIDIGTYGKRSDGGIFSAFYFISLLVRLWICLTKSCKFLEKWNRNAFSHPWWRGACPVRTSLLKPFARRDLTSEECVCNYRLSRARRCFARAFGVVTAKWRLLNKAIETNVSEAERTVRCLCLPHYVITDREGTTHDHSFLQETAQIAGSRHSKTNVSCISFSRSSEGTVDIRVACKAYFNGPTAAILSQNQ